MKKQHLRSILSEKRGEGYVDVIILVLSAVMVLALSMRVLPVFIQKQQLDTFATELVREAEVSGRVGAETSRRAAVLSEKTGIYPNVSWSENGRIQLNEEVTVTPDTGYQYRPVWGVCILSHYASGKGFRKVGSILEVRWLRWADKFGRFSGRNGRHRFQ